MNVTPVIALAFGLNSVTVSTEIAFAAICDGENDFDTTGGGVTVSVAVLLGLPAGTPVAAAALVVFGLLPGDELVTVTVIVHPVVGTLPLVIWKLVIPAAAFETTPVHVPPTVGDASCMLTSVSVKLSPVRAAPVAFDSVNVIVDVPPGTIVLGANAFVIPIPPTCKVAAAGLPVPALVDVTLPVELANAAVEADRTLTVIVQLPPTARVPAVIPTDEPPLAPVTVPEEPAVHTMAGAVLLTNVPLGTPAG